MEKAWPWQQEINRVQVLPQPYNRHWKVSIGTIAHLHIISLLLRSGYSTTDRMCRCLSTSVLVLYCLAWKDVDQIRSLLSNTPLGLVSALSDLSPVLFGLRGLYHGTSSIGGGPALLFEIGFPLKLSPIRRDAWKSEFAQPFSPTKYPFLESLMLPCQREAPGLAQPQLSQDSGLCACHRP